MAVHRIGPTDNWPGIAGRYGIKYWQNIYLAPENSALRAKRGDPANFKIGDVLHIPKKASILPMERHPTLVHRRIPLFTQSELTCWRATAKMLYLFRFPKSSEAAFVKRIGPRYSKLEAGLEYTDWSDFYVRCLGMTEKKVVLYNDLHYLLATRGPVVAAMGSGSGKHSVLMAGYDILKGRWLRLDPASGEKFTFEEDEIVVGPAGKGAPKPATPGPSATHTPAPATWEAIAGWLWLRDYEIDPRVFFY